jgi:DNA repair protein RadC
MGLQELTSLNDGREVTMKVSGVQKGLSASNAADVAKVFQELLRAQDKLDQDKEYFWVMHLNARNCIRQVELIAIGSLNSVNIHPREVFRRAVAEGSASIILAHNHPSGEVDPSEDDIHTTRRLHEGGEVLGIPLIDHLIVSLESFFSFRMNKSEAILKPDKYWIEQSPDRVSSGTVGVDR